MIFHTSNDLITLGAQTLILSFGSMELAWPTSTWFWNSLDQKIFQKELKHSYGGLFFWNIDLWSHIKITSSSQCGFSEVMKCVSYICPFKPLKNPKLPAVCPCLTTSCWCNLPWQLIGINKLLPGVFCRGEWNVHGVFGFSKVSFVFLFPLRYQCFQKYALVEGLQNTKILMAYALKSGLVPLNLVLWNAFLPGANTYRKPLPS